MKGCTTWLRRTRTARKKGNSVCFTEINHAQKAQIPDEVGQLTFSIVLLQTVTQRRPAIPPE